MNYTFFQKIAFVLLMITVFTGCDDSDDPEPAGFSSNRVEDLAADPETAPDGTALETTSKFTLFSFEDNTTIDNADSASVKWDIGFNGTTIIVNGGDNGPGQGAVQIIDGIFDELTEAPAEGYEAEVAAGAWYTYTGEAPAGPKHAILPKAGKIFVIKTAEGNYAKMEILSYYYGTPDTTTEEFANLATRPPARYYTFRYAYQGDGSLVLEEE